jgi:hypothetical protein
MGPATVKGGAVNIKRARYANLANVILIISLAGSLVMVLDTVISPKTYRAIPIAAIIKTESVSKNATVIKNALQATNVWLGIVRSEELARNVIQTTNVLPDIARMVFAASTLATIRVFPAIIRGP